MSWSLYGRASYKDAERVVWDATPTPDSTAPEQVKQVVTAKAAAVAIIRSGQVVNDASQDVAFMISGHANPGHKPTEGYGNDSIAVSITQVTPDA